MNKIIFSLNEANAAVKEVYQLTKTCSSRVETLILHLDKLAQNHPEAPTIESKVNTLINEWQEKVQTLGAMPKGLWMCDFDSGDGYFCWKYPERSIGFKHSYTQGYSNRIAITKKTTFKVVEF